MGKISGRIKKIMHRERQIYLGRTAAIVLAAALIGLYLSRAGVMKENILMVLLIGVILTGAFTAGYEYGVIGAVASVLIFNYFFTVPVHTFAIMNPDDVVLMIFFLIVSFISSAMTARFRRQVAIAEENERTARRMSELSERFINVTGTERITELGLSYIKENTGYDVAVRLDERSRDEHSTDKHNVDKCNTDKHSTDGQPDTAGAVLFPIGGIARKTGEIIVFTKDRGLGAEQEIFIRAVAGQMGIALDRERIYEKQEKTKLQVEREHLKSSMLRSISHDFRTPLTGIIGDCDLILQRHVTGSEEQDELLMDIREQSMWLTRTMENILSMTKIESGADFISRREEVVEDLVYEAESHVSGLREHRRFQDSMPEEVLIADVDARLIVQVLVNLLDNAVKHTKENGLIRLNVSYQDGRAYFVVEDNGPGIEPGQEETIFGEFVSLAGRGPDQKHGMGLGLAICREVVKAHGGEIRAENRPEGGARFVFWLNAQPAVQMEEMEEEYGGTERDGREADHIDR